MRGAAVFALAVLLAPSAAAQTVTPAIAEQAIVLQRPAELKATIHARCDDCAWEVEGREAVTLTLSVDGRYSQHLPLVRSGHADYTVLLGRADAGRHTVRARVDPATTAAGLRRARSASAHISIAPVFDDAPEHLALSLAPFVYARPNTVGRFTDTPVFMWYETERTARGTRYRYSVIFTNEDGGTPADRLMATWGRTTDIEYIYSVEVDGSGGVLAEDYQAPEHQVLPFRGRRDGRHPLLWVVTDNNMVKDAGETTIRYAPAPVHFPLNDVSREAVMDANPWMYAVTGKEMAREQKIVNDAPPGHGTIPDTRRFVYLEACGEVGSAALAFAVRVGDAWLSSDRGVPEYRIVRDGCFRGAVPLPAGARASDVRALRFMAHERPARPGAAPAAATPVRLTRINKLFMLDDRFVPGPSLLHWTGSELIHPGGAPFEIKVTSLEHGSRG